jgi:hypothetical protein
MKKQRLKISCYCPFKILSIAKNIWLSKRYIISSYSMANNMPKIAEMKFSICRLESVVIPQPFFESSVVILQPFKKMLLCNSAIIIFSEVRKTEDLKKVAHSHLCQFLALGFFCFIVQNLLASSIFRSL